MQLWVQNWSLHKSNHQFLDSQLTQKWPQLGQKWSNQSLSLQVQLHQQVEPPEFGSAKSWAPSWRAVRVFFFFHFLYFFFWVDFWCFFRLFWMMFGAFCRPFCFPNSLEGSLLKRWDELGWDWWHWLRAVQGNGVLTMLEGWKGGLGYGG